MRFQSGRRPLSPVAIIRVESTSDLVALNEVLHRYRKIIAVKLTSGQVNDYDLALNYMDYTFGARRSFGHDFYAAGRGLIELLDELNPITLADIFEAWWKNDRRRMLKLLRCDLELFEKARDFRSVLHYKEF